MSSQELEVLRRSDLLSVVDVDLRGPVGKLVQGVLLEAVIWSTGVHGCSH